MPSPRAGQNLQMPHPRDWKGRQLPRSSPGGGDWLGAAGIEWLIIKLLLLGPPRPSNCIDRVYIDRHILTTCIEKIEKYLLAKDKVECILKCKLLITKV